MRVCRSLFVLRLRVLPFAASTQVGEQSTQIVDDLGGVVGFARDRPAEHVTVELVGAAVGEGHALGTLTSSTEAAVRNFARRSALALLR